MNRSLVGVFLWSSLLAVMASAIGMGATGGARGAPPANREASVEGGVTIASVAAGTRWKIGVVSPTPGAVWTIDGVPVTGGDTFTPPSLATPYSTIDLEYGVPEKEPVYTTTLYVTGQAGSSLHDLPLNTRKPVGPETIDRGATQTVHYVNDGSPEGTGPITEDDQSVLGADPGTPLDPPAEFDETVNIVAKDGKYFIPCFVEGDPDETIVYLKAFATPGSDAPEPIVQKGKVGPFNARKTGGCNGNETTSVTGHHIITAFSGHYINLGNIQVNISAKADADMLRLFGVGVEVGGHGVSLTRSRFINYKQWWTTDYYRCDNGRWVYEYSRRCVQWNEGFRCVPPWYVYTMGYPPNGAPRASGWTTPACRDYPP